MALALAFGLILAPGPASAQEPISPPDAEQPPDRPSAGKEELATDQARDLARLEALIRSHAIEARNQRLAAGGIFIAVGLAAVPVGIVAQTSWNENYGIGFWVSGALLIGFGTLSLVLESPLERLDTVFQTTARLPTAERLAYGERSLAEVAAASRTGRTVSAVVSFALAGLFVGVAIGEAVSASNSVGSDRSDQQAAAASGFVLGGFFAGAGVVTLLFPTPAETAFAAYETGRRTGGPGIRLSAGVAPIRGGAQLGVGGVF